MALIACSVAVVAVLAGCGGGSDDSPNVLSAGQLNIQLPAGYKVVDGKVQRPASAKPAKPAKQADATGPDASIRAIQKSAASGSPPRSDLMKADAMS